MKIPLAAVPVLLAGCAVRQPQVWRIENRLLVPPVQKQPIALKTTGDCASSDAIAAQRKRSRVLLAVNGAALAKQPSGWLAAWSDRIEDSGCVPAGQGRELARRVLEAAPLPLAAPYSLMHPNGARTGYVDLGPEYRLEVVTPIVREGGQPVGEIVGVSGSGSSITVDVKSSPDLLGVETAWYAVRTKDIEPLSAEARIQGKPEPRSWPAQNLFATLHGNFFRLLYKADQTEVVLAAVSRKQLDDPDCPQLVVPRHVAVNPYIAVKVNGAEVRIPVGLTVRTAIRAAGKRPEEVMGTLAIIKPLAGRPAPVMFDRTKTDVLDLVLAGNEEIRW